MSENLRVDMYEQELDRMLEALKSCQQEQGVFNDPIKTMETQVDSSIHAQDPHIAKSQSKQGCFSCENLLACDLRKQYVSAVYKSMSKGQNTDFDF